MLEPRKPSGPEEIAREIAAHGVRHIRLIFADILGQSKSLVIPAARLGDALDGRVTFDGGTVDGFVRDQEIDMILKPDTASFALARAGDGSVREARFICNLVMPDGEPFEGCPRTTLRRVLDDAADLLPNLRAALEVEFYLFASIDKETPRTDDAQAYFDSSAVDRGELVRVALVEELEFMGVPVAASHHEHGAGQHEIDVAAAGVLAAADHLLTLRMVAKNVAARFGMHATFMPKPSEDSAGSGLHLYFSWGQNAAVEHDAASIVEPPPLPEYATDFKFEEERDRDAQELQAMFGEATKISDDMLYGVGGLLRHACGFTAVCNPTINSYKRLVAAWDAPLYTVWSHRSANALVRIPLDRDRPRVEVRSPDPSCNPYLALAVLVASMVDGIRKRRLPGESRNDSAYTIDEQERVELGIAILPRSLREAITALDADLIVRNALGDHIYGSFYEAKTAEYEQYRRTVHPWERNAYLRAY